MENDGFRKYGASPMRFITPSSSSYGLQLNDNGVLNFGGSTGEAFGMGVNETGQFEFLTNGSTTFGTSNTKMLIDDDNGNVGIGVLNPQAKLDVIGGEWDLAGGSNGDLRIGNDTYNLRIGIATGGGGAGDIRMFAKGGTGRMIWGSGTTDQMAMNSDGKFGIGSLDPTNKFEIYHNSLGNDDNSHISKNNSKREFYQI